MDAIDFQAMLNNTKKRLALEFKSIKKMSLYNYLNDSKPNVIVDCRLNYDDNLTSDGGVLKNAFYFKIFPDDIPIKDESRLIIISDDDVDFGQAEEFEELRTYIKGEDKFRSGIFLIKAKDFRDFVHEFPFYFINELTSDISLQVAETKFPLMIIDKCLYVGNFLNSRNLFQLKNLQIKSMIALLTQEDTIVQNVFSYHLIESDEANHSEIDFIEAIEAIDFEKESGNTPILVYCFSGQSSSIAVCIAYLMKSKKWSLEFATAYMMKICPNMNLPSWLYSQLQRLDIKKI